MAKWFTALCSRLHLRRLRSALRTNRKFRRDNQLYHIETTKIALSNQLPKLGDGQNFERFWQLGPADFECGLHQYLMSRIAGFRHNIHLLASYQSRSSTHWIPYPPLWYPALEKLGYRFSKTKSRLAWMVLALTYFGYGICKSGAMLAKIAPIRRVAGLTDRSSIYFEGLAPNNITASSDLKRDYSLTSWYVLDYRGKKLKNILHSVPGETQKTLAGHRISYTDPNWGTLQNWRVWSRLVFWWLVAICYCVGNFVVGRPWYALMFLELFKAKRVRLLPKDRLAAAYWFHNSTHIYRPLWTYHLQKQGCDISMYFYSTNCDGFKRPDKYLPAHHQWEMMSWPNYRVWDEEQENFVRRYVASGPTIEQVGPIGFFDTATEFEIDDGPSICVFDVQPVRDSIYETLGVSFDYYKPEIAFRFFSDVVEVAQDLGFSVYWKRKREIGKLVHPRFVHMVENLRLQNPNLKLIDPDVSAHRLIERSDLVISMPYTSTSLIANLLAKPSAYYDTLALLQKDDRAAHGVPVLQGKAELTAWLSGKGTV